jgi:tetratricopeptide (TPR) repeat protein
MERDYASSETLLSQAFALAPNDVETLCWTVPTLSYIGQTEEAIRRAQRALSLSPLDPFRFRHEHFLSIAYYAADDFESSASWGLRSWERNRNYSSNLRITVAALSAAGKVDKARELAQQLLSIQPALSARETASTSGYHVPDRRQMYARHLVAAGIPE